MGEAFSLKSAEGKAWYKNVIKKHPVLKNVSIEELQREITDSILSAILEGHEKVLKAGVISKDCNGETVTCLPLFAGIVGDNLEQLRWLHCPQNTCHVCSRPKAELGSPGWLKADSLKHSQSVLYKISTIRWHVIDFKTGALKKGMKKKATELCKKAGIHITALHKEMAPIIRQNHCDAFQVVSEPCYHAFAWH